jgi:hypothetical protein
VNRLLTHINSKHLDFTLSQHFLLESGRQLAQIDEDVFASAKASTLPLIETPTTHATVPDRYQASSSEMISTSRWVGPSLVFDVADDSINFLIRDPELYAEP